MATVTEAMVHAAVFKARDVAGLDARIPINEYGRACDDMRQVLQAALDAGESE